MTCCVDGRGLNYDYCKSEHARCVAWDEYDVRYPLEGKSSLSSARIVFTVVWRAGDANSIFLTTAVQLSGETRESEDEHFIQRNVTNFR